MRFGKLKYRLFEPDKHLKTPLVPFLLVIIVFIIGTIGYSLFWRDYNADVIDAAYMVFITMTTIGFQELYPLGDYGRIFTIFIGLTGISSLFYVFSVIMENIVIIQMYNLRGKNKMKKKIANLENHIILIGFGRVGKLAAKELEKNEQAFVVIESNKEITENFDEKTLIISGDATDDEILLNAGIKKAKGMIVTTANSASTMFVVLSAKVLNPEIFIVARTDDDNDIEKLKRAGADKVVNPYSIGGQRLANLLINPNVIDFFETSFGKNNLNVERIIIPLNCKYINKSLKEINLRYKSGATVVAILRDGNPIINPQAEFLISTGDELIALGTTEQLISLENIILME
jgi:voltage-gated potassium channel